MKCDAEFLYKFSITTFSHIEHKILIDNFFYVFDDHLIGE
jgi:hypothetical protein